MTVPVPSTAGDDDDGRPGKRLAARVAAGPGAWEDEEWLAGLRRESLLESLMADGTIAAAGPAEHARKQERALNAEVTAPSLAGGALFPALGYENAMALVFGLPGVPAPGAKPLLRLAGLLHSASRRWKAAAAGRYLDGENALADELEEYLGPGQLNLADRGLFSMDRWIRSSGTGARLLWRAAACGPAAARRPATAPCRACRTPWRGWRASPC